jgi:hypothetical protein
MDIPFWIYFVVMGIITSAYMVVRTGKEEKLIEEELIEREGDIYMQRLEQEREGKKESEQSLGVSYNHVLQNRRGCPKKGFIHLKGRPLFTII